MDLTAKSYIKNLLQEYAISPSKRLGQHFLADQTALDAIIRTADLKAEDIVLEIGPGIGVLTQELAKRAKRVVAVEKDPRLFGILKETLKDFKNVEIICGDILKIEKQPYGESLFGSGQLIENLKLKIGNSYKVVANLPYYIVSPVIRQFLERTEDGPLYAAPEQMVLMVQKEVAQRICAKPPKMSILAVSVQFYAKPEIVSYVAKTSFWPQPKVDSAILRINPLMKADRKQIDTDLFFRVVKAGFSQPRKQLINNLSRLHPAGFGGQVKYDKKKIAAWLLKNNIQPSQRAETLTLNDWLNLTKTLK